MISSNYFLVLARAGVPPSPARALLGRKMQQNRMITCEGCRKRHKWNVENPHPCPNCGSTWGIWHGMTVNLKVKKT